MSEPPVPAPGPAGGDPHTPGPLAASVTLAEPPACATRTRQYRKGEMVAEGFPAAEISERLAADPDSVVWLDLHDPDEHDLRVVTDELSLHPLAVEDAIHDHQRPKLDRYRTHLFANAYAVRFDEGSGQLTTAEISAFVTKQALVTVRKSAFDIDAVLARWDAASENAAQGVGFLVHGLLDSVVDGHKQAVEEIHDAIDDLEEVLFNPHPGYDVRRRGYELRKSVVQLRRIVTPMRDVVGRLLRNQPELVGDLAPYYEDVYDHVLSATEGLESARDLIVSVLEADMNEHSNQLNEITKKLAAWAAIIAVPTAVTGFYGQNVPYPGFSRHWGFAASTTVIVVLAVGLYVTLRRRGWM